MARVLTIVGALAIGAAALAACGDSSAQDGAAERCFDKPAAPPIAVSAADRDRVRGTTITLATHDSFALSDGTLERFTAATGVSVRVLKADDAGAMVSQAVITSGRPTADVMFGVDNTFMCKALAADVFAPYSSPALANVDNGYQLDPHRRLTPVDVGDVCVNYWKSSFATNPPRGFDDLAKPDYRGQFVTPHVDTSSPGFAFMLSTIAKYGESGWESYWKKLRDNKVEVTSGWTQAYTEKFKSGGGERTIVTSYASSPAAEVVFSEGKLAEPPTAVIGETCFRQIEFAGVLRGTAHPQAAALLVDFLLSDDVQNDIPLNMFVFPVSKTATVPAEFSRFAQLVERPLTMDPAKIEANRVKWTERWVQTVLR